MLNDLAREIRDEIIDKINEMEREENFDMNDFAFQLWEEEDVNGTLMPERFQVIMSIEVTLNLLSQIWKDGLSKKEIISRLEELS